MRASTMPDGEKKVGEAAWVCLDCGRTTMKTPIHNVHEFRSLLGYRKHQPGQQCRACAGRAVPFYNIEEFHEEYAAVEKEDIDIDTSGPYDFPFEFVDSNE